MERGQGLLASPIVALKPRSVWERESVELMRRLRRLEKDDVPSVQDRCRSDRALRD